MAQERLQYIYNPQELTKTIEECSKNAKKIKFYSSCFIDREFNSHHFDYVAQSRVTCNMWLKKHLASLAIQKTNIEIHDYCLFNPKNISEATTFYVDSRWKKTQKQSYIQVFLEQSDTSKILYDFINSLNPYGKSISQAMQDILNKKDKGLKFLEKCIYEHLQNPLIEQIALSKELQDSNQEIMQSIKNIFSNLLEDIRNIHKEGSAQLYKEILSFFLNIVDIFDIKKLFSKVNIIAMGIYTLLEGAERFLNLLEWYSHRYNNAIYKNLIGLLVEDIAPIFIIIENSIFHQSLIIDDKICIELGGLATNIYQTQAGIKQELAVCFRANSDIFKDINRFSDFIYHNQKEQITIFGKNHIENILQDIMSVDKNRLTFIESPFFNSTKLAKIIQENNKKEENNKQQKNKNQSNQSQNFLIITNAPRKYNASLNKRLIEEILGNKIHYPHTITDEKYNEVLAKSPNDYEATINYSQYKITINSKAETNEAAFVLSLSPFLHIDYMQYKEFEDTENEAIQLERKSKDNDDSFIQYHNFTNNQSNIDKIFNYRYIQQYFITPKSKKDILEKEKQYFKEGIDCIQNYIDALTTTNWRYNKINYNIKEVFLLALTYYVIKNFYVSIVADCKKLWIFEQGEILTIDNQEEIKFLPMNACLVLENKKMCLCLSQQRKQEILKEKQSKEVFCIEELVDSMEQNELPSKIDVLQEYLGNHFENKTENKIIEKNKNIAQEEIDENLIEIKNATDKELQTQKDLDKEITNIFQSLKKQEPQYDYHNVLDVIIETFIDEFFPLKNAIDDTYKMSKVFAKAITHYCDKGIEEAFYKLFGFAYLPYVLLKYDVKITQQQGSHTRAKIREKELSKKALCSLVYMKKNAKRYQILITANPSLKELKTIEAPLLNAIKIKSGFLMSAFKEANKNALKAIPQAIVANMIDSLWVTNYEKIKKEYERLLFLKFAFKYDQPYAIKRKPYLKEKGSVTYPMLICNTFIACNFLDLIVGSKLQTGGLGEKEALFFLQKDCTRDNTRTYLLNKLLAYLCLDELRGMNGRIDKEIGDIEFFNTRSYTNSLPTKPRLLRLKHNEEDFKNSKYASVSQRSNTKAYNNKLNEINKDKQKASLYQEYKDNELDGIEAIDAYHQCMEYLEDISEGIFNTEATNNNAEILKHRKFLKNLDIIGQNNIKALYVGIGENLNKSKNNKSKNEQDEMEVFAKDKNQNNVNKEKRPKLVGRLATTIIMKDGLYIG